MPLAHLHKGESVISLAAVRSLAETRYEVGASGLEAAELVVALASSQSKAAVVSAAVARAALAGVSEKHRKKVEAVWDKAHKEALELLILVMENNPLGDKEALFNRPDVQSSLTVPYLEAAAQCNSLMQDAFADTEELTVKHLKAEFKLLKEEWQGHDVDEALLHSLLGDLRANAEGMRSRYFEALSAKGSVEENLSKVAKDATRRAGYSAQTVVWGTATNVRDNAFARAGLNKMWVARVEDKENPPCPHCKNLHGKIVGPLEQFPKAGLKTYKGVLYGPPRHPNCRCMVVGTKLKKNGKS